jgi:hypothetical protein
MPAYSRIAHFRTSGCPPCTRLLLECLAAGRLYADDCPASLVSCSGAIDELTERIEALTDRRATLITNLNAVAHRAAASNDPRRPEQEASTT